MEMDAKPEVLSQHGWWIRLSCSHFPRPTGKFSLAESKHREDNVQPGPASSDHAWSLSSTAVVDNWLSMSSTG